MKECPSVLFAFEILGNPGRGNHTFVHNCLVHDFLISLKRREGTDWNLLQHRHEAEYVGTDRGLLSLDLNAMWKFLQDPKIGEEAILLL